MPMMKVLLWSPGGAGTHYYGPGNFAFRMYRKRDPGKLRVSLIHGSVDQQYFPEVFDSQTFLSRLTPIKRSSILTPITSRFNHYYRRLAYIRRGSMWLEKNIMDFDILHGLGNMSDTLIPALHASKLNVPACTTVMIMRGELEDQSRLRRWLRFSDKRLALISRLDAVVAFSRDIERTLLERGVPEQKVVYIPSCVDPSRFGPAESDSAKHSLRAKIAQGSDPLIVCVGELTERKGAHLLLQALRELETFRLKWQLVLAGPPNELRYAQQLQAYVDDQGWNQRVRFLAHIDNIEDIYKAADIFCLPSRDEGMPGALLEAMASGLPCIITPFSSAKELIDDGFSGRIISRTSSDIANALKPYLVDDDLRIAHGSAARQTALAGYTTEIILGKYMALFGRLIAGATPRQD